MKDGMLYRDLTENVLGACFDVMNELGAGFLESVYEKALMVALRDRALPLNHKFQFLLLLEEKRSVNFSLIFSSTGK